MFTQFGKQLGRFDGAESCEILGSYILHLITTKHAWKQLEITILYLHALHAVLLGQWLASLTNLCMRVLQEFVL
jgi:hypothetical protein